MIRPTRVLLIEDMPSDADLAIRHLRKAGFEIEPLQVTTRIDLEVALYQFAPDLILSDYSLPGFGGMEALKIARQSHPDIPFIFLSGTIGEERAIEALKLGATDYVLKDNRARFVSAVQRALTESEEHQKKQRVEHELGVSEERFRIIADATGEWIWEMNSHGAYIYCNRAVTTILGYTPEELTDLNSIYLIKEDRQENFARFFHTSLKEKSGWYNQLWPWCGKDGAIRWLESSGLPILDSSGQVIAFRGLNRDVTERMQQQERISRLNRIHGILSGINSTIVRIRDRHELFREVCRIAVAQGKFSMAWIGLAGPRTNTVEAATWAGSEEIYLMELKNGNRTASTQMYSRVFKEKKAIVVNDNNNDPLFGSKSKALAEHYRSMAAFPLLVDGQVVGVMVLYANEPGFFNDDEVKLLKCLAADISFGLYHIVQMERLAYVSQYDTLTGLANRQLFTDRLAQSIQKAQMEKLSLAVMVIDIQQFRNVNDTLGRGAGDSLLKVMADRLLKTFGETATPARLNGDRFAVAMTSLSGATLATELDGRILYNLAKPFEYEGVELRPATKIGIAHFPEDGLDTETLLMNAEAALRQAKDTTDGYVLYTREINEQIGHRLHFENRLRKAVENKQFQLCYQTKVDLVTRKIHGLEALIRWRDPERGQIPPAEFIPLLEETGLIIEVGHWIMKQVVSDIREWQALKLEIPRVAINVSQLQLRKKNFVAIVLGTLGLNKEAIESDFGPVGVDIEITESFISKDVDANVKMLHQLRAAGLKIYVDDFGTGYSSLSQITELPIDALKIDQSFIASMAQSAEHRAIVSNIINLAKTLNIAVVAEGVETEEQAKLLQSLGCDQAQGFLFQYPLPAIEIAQILWATNSLEKLQ